MAITVDPLEFNKSLGFFDNMDKLLPFFKISPEIGYQHH